MSSTVNPKSYKSSGPTSNSQGTSISGQNAGQRGLDPASTILSTDFFNESDVKELVGLGFTREQAIVELRRFNGDKHQATAALFAKSLKF